MGLVWQMPVPVACSLAVEGAGIAATCGQCPLDVDGRVLEAGNAAAQARLTADSTLTVQGHLAEARHPAFALLYHTADEAGEVVAPFAQAFPGALLAPVRLPHFYYPGMMIEADVFFAEAPPRLRVVEAAGAVARLAETDALTFVVLEAEGSADAEAVLRAAGLTPERLLSAHWFSAAPAPEGWHPDPRARVVPPRGQGIVATMTFAPGPVAVAQTPGGAVMRSHGDLAWISAVAGGGDLALAATAAMDALDLPGLAGLTPIKATTHYAGGPTPHDLHANLAVRHARFPMPGPASTGVPVRALAGGVISIDMLMARA